MGYIFNLILILMAKIYIQEKRNKIKKKLLAYSSSLSLCHYFGFRDGKNSSNYDFTTYRRRHPYGPSFLHGSLSQ